MMTFVQFTIPLLIILVSSWGNKESVLLTVTGEIPASAMGITLPHEHIVVDFIGADSVSPDRYDSDSVFIRVLPFLNELKKHQVQTFIECTPNYLGRDVRLLQRLSKETGINIITNTGYYGAAHEKYLPKHAFTESAEELAQRWIDEFNNGIEGTGIKPGFMKLSADTGPLTETQRKIMKAGALAHLKTGLSIAVHSGDGNAAKEELEIFFANGVAPEAFIWVHAQNEKNYDVFKEMASKGVWVEFDYVHTKTIEQYVEFMNYMKANNLLHRTLLSHDAGWYNVGEAGGGSFRGFTALFEILLPRLLKEGFTQNEIDQVIKINPAQAFRVGVRKR
ncbi:MAG: phosphotriesterase [Cyclobacteriaceae bacterium]|nr:phosphotriesterase [Cyclobacteriaceae bacterium]UYN87058.1 MAG: phosphotriesterase [Cyclobacteriaceae bacterium]